MDAADLLWSQYQANINIAPNTSVTRNANLVVPGLALGSYHIIVRTDMTNFFLETDESNNRTVSASLITLDFESLRLNVTENAVLPDLANLYYKLQIPDSLAGESFLLILKGDSINGNNEIYASFNQVPTRIHYQYRNSYYFEGNQELVIPSLTPGLYYFLVTGNTTSGNQQNITLKPEILAFEVRSIEMNQGGNLGNVTVRIRGSKFTPQTTFSLVRDTCEISGSDLIFINSTEVVVSFALYSSGIGSMEWDRGSAYGFMDVKAFKPDGALPPEMASK